MKSKVINLYSKPIIIQNQGVKYSTLLEQFMTPFVKDFADFKNYDDILEFAINAWNLGNMKSIIPKSEADAAINAAEEEGVDVVLLKKMIDYKVSHFKKYTNFIADYELKKTSGDPILSVITQEEDAFLANMIEEMEDGQAEDNFQENFINRSAIIIKPLQPFLDWCANLYPDEIEEMKTTNTYLISEGIEDVDVWLKKKFDKIFSFELEFWHLNKKEWPQKRNYKMFQEWFQVDVSTMIYDFEKMPVFKSE